MIKNMIKLNFDPFAKFGIKGDGITDDTLAIQEAINFSNLKGWKSLFLPAREYLISDTLFLPSSFELSGNYYNTVLKLKDNSNCDMISCKSTFQNEFITIKNIRLEANAINQIIGSGINLINCIFANINNVVINRPKVNGIMLTNNSGKYSYQPTLFNIKSLADPINTVGSGIICSSSDASISVIDIGFYKRGVGIIISGDNGSELSNCKCWQNNTGYSITGVDRLRINNVLADYSNQMGFYFDNVSNIMGCNIESRGSAQGETDINLAAFGIWVKSGKNCQFLNIKTLGGTISGSNDIYHKYGLVIGDSVTITDNIKITNTLLNGLIGTQYIYPSATNIIIN